MDRISGFRWPFFNLCKLTTFAAYLDCSIFLICCSGWVWESFPTNKVSVAILSRLGDFWLRLTGLLRRSDNLNTNNDEFFSVAILLPSQRHQGFCASRLHTSTVGNVKIARYERSYYCYIHMPTFHIV